jgi:hypothetical protein
MSVDFDIAILSPRSCAPFEYAAASVADPTATVASVLAAALARAGSRVTLFCDIREASFEGPSLQFSPASGWRAYVAETEHDVAISFAGASAFTDRTRARLNVLFPDRLPRGRDRNDLTRVLWNIDRLIVPSNELKNLWQPFVFDDVDRIGIIPLGVDRRLLEDVSSMGAVRDARALVFCSNSPARLRVLLRDVMPRLVASDPRWRLFAIWPQAATRSESDRCQRECATLAAMLGDRVVKLSDLTIRDFYRLVGSAALCLHPPFPDGQYSPPEWMPVRQTECLAAGLPIVATEIGPNIDTGRAIANGSRRDNHTLASAEAFVDAIVRQSEQTAQTASEGALDRGDAVSDWDTVAKDWRIDLEQAIRARNNAPDRLIRHLLREGDRCAANALQTTPAAPSHHALDSNIQNVPISGPAASYVPWDVAPISTQWWDPIALGLTANWLTQHPARPRRVLDCAPRHDDLGAILKSTVDYRRVPLRELPRVTADGERFDCGLLRGVLETSPEPWLALDAIEATVRSQGSVYILVGPHVDANEDTGAAFPEEKVWNLDAHDLREMLGSKPDLTVSSCHVPSRSVHGRASNWWIVTYTADHRAAQAIDVNRHSWLQRPPQTLAAAIIAGPHCEDTLHWTLRSVAGVVDDLVIADCGMSDEALRIVRQYPARIVRGVDPQLSGFDEARNRALGHCVSDWCLCIDTDERLVDGHNLRKYLRDNPYHGYAIQQHNFACDVRTTPDFPVRLFRLSPRNGKRLRFWGALHEHPEFGVNEGSGPTMCLPDVFIAHVGYLSERGRRARFVRNTPLLKLDQERYPQRLVQKFFVMRENMHLVRFALSRPEADLTERLRALCRDTIDLFRRHFLGTTFPMTSNALEYYSEALGILNEGFDACIDLYVGDAFSKPVPPRRLRFGSRADLVAEFDRLVRERLEGRDAADW